MFNALYAMHSLLPDRNVAMTDRSDNVLDPVGTLHFRTTRGKVVQTLKQPYGDVSPKSLALGPGQDKLTFPAAFFWPATNNVLYMYTLVLRTSGRLGRDFKILLPKSAYENFDVKFKLISMRKATDALNPTAPRELIYTLRLSLLKKKDTNELAYFCSFYGEDQMQLVTSTQIRKLTCTVTPEPIVFGPLRYPCALDLAVTIGDSTLKARFNSKSCGLIRTYFKRVRDQIQESQLL